MASSIASRSEERGVGTGLEASEYLCPEEESFCRFCDGGVVVWSSSSFSGCLFGGDVGVELLLLGEAAAARCMN